MSHLKYKTKVMCCAIKTTLMTKTNEIKLIISQQAKFSYIETETN